LRYVNEREYPLKWGQMLRNRSSISRGVSDARILGFARSAHPDNQLHSVRLGAVSEPSGTTKGVLYIDDYESRRYNTIGLLPERGVEDPDAVQEAGWAERVYSYQRSQPFAVQQVTTEEGTSTYDYDANGNMTARVENGLSWTHTYNAENRLASMTNGDTTWLFSYDGDGTLVGQLVTDGRETQWSTPVTILRTEFAENETAGATATHTAFFMGGGYEVVTDGVNETVRKYYSLAAPLAALGGAPLRYASSTFGMSDNGVMKYLISDHLGSTVAITDSTGNVLAETRYMPFGEPRADVGSLAGTDKTFTGQRDVPDTGLMDYWARHYSPYLNRWTQPDTIIPNITNPQDWNRYTYTRNNPIKYVDPSGHKACTTTNGFDCDDTEDKVNKVLDYVEKRIITKKGELRNNNETPLGAMIKVVKKAGTIFYNDWNNFLDVTNYVFTGYYGHGANVMNMAHYSSFQGYFKNVNDLGFHPDFQDDDTQVRHFWAGFASAIDPVGDNVFGAINAHYGNILHDWFSDVFLNRPDTTVIDYKLTLTAIDIAKQAGRGKNISSPYALGIVFEEKLGVNGGYTGNPIFEWLWISPYENNR